MQLSSVEKKEAKQKSFWMFLSCWELINLQSGPAWFWKRLVVVWSGSGGECSEWERLWNGSIVTAAALISLLSAPRCCFLPLCRSGVQRRWREAVRVSDSADRPQPGSMRAKARMDDPLDNFKRGNTWGAPGHSCRVKVHLSDRMFDVLLLNEAHCADLISTDLNSQI